MNGFLEKLRLMSILGNVPYQLAVYQQIIFLRMVIQASENKVEPVATLTEGIWFVVKQDMRLCDRRMTEKLQLSKIASFSFLDMLSLQVSSPVWSYQRSWRQNYLNSISPYLIQASSCYHLMAEHNCISHEIWVLKHCLFGMTIHGLAGFCCTWRALEQIQDLLNNTKDFGNMGVCFNIYLQGLAEQPKILVSR